MGILLGDTTMGCPTGVANADAAGKALGSVQCRQLGNPSNATPPL
ncbi:MAG: hypothetical protein U7M05_01465 [Candidatus Igneacidithiobacillus chanchocoensis]